LKKYIIKLAFVAGQITNYLVTKNLADKVCNFFHFLHSGRFSGQVSYCGYPVDLRYPTYLAGGKYIKIGKNFHASYRLRIEAWDKYKDVSFKPSILIGDNVSFSDNCHIGAINLIQIGNNVLFGSNVYVTDHFHGTSTSKDIDIHPLERDLFSKGAVVIEDDVWIGDGVCIMPNVKIGQSCIVGANSVVTKSFPSNCVIAGVPATIIKYLK
jgi:acetyltransferase-like isoleucine patch superfamily enzyme